MLDRYSRPALREIWSDRRRFETWLEVELSACAAMEEEPGWGVPVGTAARVREKAAGRIDPARILAIEQQTRHDVIAFLTHVEELAGAEARWLHLGMTSSDVLDTSLALQLCAAVDAIDGGLGLLCDALRRRAIEHRATPMIGRSHGIHAEPTTLGLVFAGLLAETTRNRRRLAAARDEIAVGKIAGAVGTYAHLDPAIEARALGRLGLRPETVATQIVARDRHAVLFDALAVTAASIERIALAIRHWQRTEVGEAEEAFGKGQKGSSAMPHKKNPILSENLTGLARLVRGYAGAALEDIALWHERDISHSSVERVIGPDATMLVDFMAQRAAALVDGLVVHPERMRANLDLTRGLIFSEGVMLALVKKGLPRQQAYELVQRCALAARDANTALRDRLGSDDEVARHLSPADLDGCFDLAHHLRHAEAVLARALGEPGTGKE
ncbi:MAG: adenylosuccinate lyase [Myxococcales bacterium]|nr:adenylosuccinate lyase [Myxococcales bacterium]